MTTGSILWFLGIGAFFYFMMKNGGGCCGGHNHGGHSGHHGSEGAEQGSGTEHTGHNSMLQLEGENKNDAVALKDPVCGMEVRERTASLTSEYQGRTFPFCSEQCRTLFDLHPNNYI